MQPIISGNAFYRPLVITRSEFLKLPLSYQLMAQALQQTGKVTILDVSVPIPEIHETKFPKALA